MNIIEFFAGSRSIGKEAEKRGHHVFSTDIMPFEGIDHVGDIRDWSSEIVPFVLDMVWFSPPCTGFSVAAIGHHWNTINGKKIPKTQTAKEGIELLEKTLSILTEYYKKNQNLIFFIENPRGVMRKMPQLAQFQRHTVSYCQYGDERMKPTDIWTNSDFFVPKFCKNGAPCHIAAPRGSKTGTQGLKGSYERSKIPQNLCQEIIKSAEQQYEKNKKITFPNRL